MTEIKSFKDLGIDRTHQLPGKKIGINMVLNKEIIITDYSIDKSKYPDEGNGLCLTLQFMLEDEQRVIFTSSTILQDQIQKVLRDDFPIKATIIPLEPRGFKFT